MDAQQRLLLERTAEALSSAPHSESAAKPTSVMVGIGTVDYTSVAAHLGNSLYAASGAPLSESPSRCKSVRRVSALLRLEVSVKLQVQGHFDIPLGSSGGLEKGAACIAQRGLSKHMLIPCHVPCTVLESLFMSADTLSCFVKV